MDKYLGVDIERLPENNGFTILWFNGDCISEADKDIVEEWSFPERVIMGWRKTRWKINIKGWIDELKN